MNDVGITFTQKELEAIDNLTALLEENYPDDLIYTMDLEAILAEVDCVRSEPRPLMTATVGLKKNDITLYPAPSSKSNATAFLILVSK